MGGALSGRRGDNAGARGAFYYNADNGLYFGNQVSPLVQVQPEVATHLVHSR